LINERMAKKIRDNRPASGSDSDSDSSDAELKKFEEFGEGQSGSTLACSDDVEIARIEEGDALPHKSAHAI
jgi:hypothetical protein